MKKFDKLRDMPMYGTWDNLYADIDDYFDNKKEEKFWGNNFPTWTIGTVTVLALIEFTLLFINLVGWTNIFFKFDFLF